MTKPQEAIAMAITWRPATESDIGMPCRFTAHDGRIWYGLVSEVDADKYPLAEVAERFTPIEDPILDVRVAVADALRFWEVEMDHKVLTDCIAVALPAYFRQKLYTEGEA